MLWGKKTGKGLLLPILSFWCELKWKGVLMLSPLSKHHWNALQISIPILSLMWRGRFCWYTFLCGESPGFNILSEFLKRIHNFHQGKREGWRRKTRRNGASERDRKSQRSERQTRSLHESSRSDSSDKEIQSVQWQWQIGNAASDQHSMTTMTMVTETLLLQTLHCRLKASNRHIVNKQVLILAVNSYTQKRG